MADRLNVYAEKLRRVQEAIAYLEDGGATASVDGVSYTLSDVETKLYPKRDLLAVRQAIQAIEEGAQRWTVLGRTFERGELHVLYARERELVARETRATRGGMRTRLGVPLP